MSSSFSWEGKGRYVSLFHSVSAWTRGVQVKLWDPLRKHAIPGRLRGVFTTRRCTNTRLPYLTLFHGLVAIHSHHLISLITHQRSHLSSFISPSLPHRDHSWVVVQILFTVDSLLHSHDLTSSQTVISAYFCPLMDNIWAMIVVWR